MSVPTSFTAGIFRFRRSTGLAALAVDKQRTRGITAVSAVALSYKGREYATAERLAYELFIATEKACYPVALMCRVLQSC